MNPQSKPAIRTCILRLCLVLGLVAFATLQPQAQTFSVFYNFANGTDGAIPKAGLVIDASGNLYGTATSAGDYEPGTVFKLDTSGQESTLHTFTGEPDGSTPEGKLLMDADGNLYGTTYYGGTGPCQLYQLSGCGTVFEIDASGNETVLYRFTGGTDGSNPVAGLIMDRFGNLYGTTFAGGAYGYGTVFELNTSGQETVLYSFTGGADGANPVGGVAFDGQGRLYGTASAGGTYGYGTVFQLVPKPIAVAAKGKSISWKENVLYTFAMQSDGGTPYAGLTFDKSGNIYGASTQGGGTGGSGGGAVFELTLSHGTWTFTVLYDLSGWNISGPYRDLLVDASGNIWGTTHCDGTDQDGTVWELSPPSSGGNTWTYSQLYMFTGGNDGYYIFSSLVFDNQGNLYGTASQGGANGWGDVFEITP